EIALPRRARPDVNRLIRHAHMERLGVGVGINRDRPNTHPPRGADHAARNLPAIGDKEGGDHSNSSPGRGGGPRREASWWRGPTSEQVATMWRSTPSMSSSK